MRPPRTIAMFAATAISLTGAAVLTAGPAEAAANCTYAGTQGGYSNTYWCNNKYGARVYDNIAIGPYSDHLYTTRSWFICYTDAGSANGETAPHPHRWVLTVGDQYGYIGWVSDKDISSETNPLPLCF